jgi:hypothetical protein
MKENSSAAPVQCMPPSPDKMQVVMNGGNASISQAGPGAPREVPGLRQEGDSPTLTFDAAVTAIRPGRGDVA